MPTVISHPAVPLALAVALGSDRVPPRLLAVGLACSVLPDVDAIGFWLGVPYGATFGHRGFSHSLLFAAVIAIAGAFVVKRHRAWAVIYLFLSTASHGLLDMLTNGGMGIALLSPWSNDRYFATWRPIPVSPMSIGGIVSGRSLATVAAELVLLWLPCFLVAGAAQLVRHVRAGTTEQEPPRNSIGAPSNPSLQRTPPG